MNRYRNILVGLSKISVPIIQIAQTAKRNCASGWSPSFASVVLARLKWQSFGKDQGPAAITFVVSLGFLLTVVTLDRLIDTVEALRPPTFKTPSAPQVPSSLVAGEAARAMRNGVTN